MQLSEIRNDIDFLLSTDSASYPNTDKDRNINLWYFRVQEMILENMGIWLFEGDKTLLDIVKDQEEYTFPSDILDIVRIEARYSSGENDWVEVEPLALQVVKDALAKTTSAYSKANPIYCKTDCLTIILRPIPKVNVTEGIKIWFVKKITKLSADSDKPIFVENFHRILSLGPSLDYAVANQILDKRNNIKSELNDIIKRLKLFYGCRSKDMKTRIVPNITSYK